MKTDTAATVGKDDAGWTVDEARTALEAAATDWAFHMSSDLFKRDRARSLTRLKASALQLRYAQERAYQASEAAWAAREARTEVES